MLSLIPERDGPDRALWRSLPTLVSSFTPTRRGPLVTLRELLLVCPAASSSTHCRRGPGGGNSRRSDVAAQRAGGAGGLYGAVIWCPRERSGPLPPYLSAPMLYTLPSQLLATPEHVDTAALLPPYAERSRPLPLLLLWTAAAVPMLFW
jgi:hypothetical protein